LTNLLTNYIITDTVLETPHVVVAAAIAVKISNPALAIPLALGSHFVLEKIPHWNPHLNTEFKKYGKVTKESTKIVLVDSTCALFLGCLIASSVLPNLTHSITILTASFFSILPDLIEAPYFFLKSKSRFIERVWIPFQKSLQVDTSPVLGLTTQLITILAAFYWIFQR